MFGGRVRQRIDPQWHSHASIPKTIIDLLGLPAMGVLGWTPRHPWPGTSTPPSIDRNRRRTGR